MVKAYLTEKYHKPGNVYLGIPHRLDRPVSGVVLFARNTQDRPPPAERFHKHQVTKTYWGRSRENRNREPGTIGCVNFPKKCVREKFPKVRKAPGRRCCINRCFLLSSVPG
jgi:23S rRNA-/tRNA-specific pseudouridylate synthase